MSKTKTTGKIAPIPYIAQPGDNVAVLPVAAVLRAPNEPCWKWDVFGDGSAVMDNVGSPPKFRRIIAQIVFGSKWKRL